MLVHVRAKARRAALQLNLPDKTAFHERTKRVIDRGVRNFWHLLFGANENFISGWMVALLHEHIIDLLPLRRETKAARLQPPAEIFI